MEVLIVDNAPAHKDYNRPLETAVERLNSCRRVDYREVAADPTLVSYFGAVVLSGVPVTYGFETIEERTEHLQWVLQTEVPLLGICISHQSLGSVFGGTIMRNEAESGIVALETVAEDPIFNGLPTRFQVATHHRASVTVPEDFLLLARTQRCANQIMKHKERLIYGIQFHPELPARRSGQIILRNFLKQAVSQPPRSETLVY